LRLIWRLLILAVLFVVTITILAISISVGFEHGTRILSTLPGGSLISLLAALISVWLAARFIDRRPWADYGMHLNWHWWLDLGYGLALGAFLMTIIALAEWRMGWITITTTFRTPSPGDSYWIEILLPLLGFLCVGIYEELLFRGYLIRNLAEGFTMPQIGARYALHIAWILSSVIFGLAHGANPNSSSISSINLILAGLGLGLAYVLTGELAIPIGIHITWNLFQGTVFGFPVSGQDFSQTTLIAIAQHGDELWTGGRFGPEAGIIGILAMGAEVLLILTWVWLRHRHIALQTMLTTR
ncbi:MAG: CPBP family intramembrane metalloprotease, partial [Chloroflexaceae bacterium]|nr:CPBP family intramembrane metalloprotease [Chloroflexaceae bacterium]